MHVVSGLLQGTCRMQALTTEAAAKVLGADACFSSSSPAPAKGALGSREKPESWLLMGSSSSWVTCGLDRR